jgi:hypothetical protein
MTDTQIAAVVHIAVTSAQRLVVALVVVHAARAAAVRELTLDDIDLAGRRISLVGHPQRLGEFVHGRCASGCSNGRPRGRTPRTGTSWSPRSP